MPGSTAAPGLPGGNDFARLPYGPSGSQLVMTRSLHERGPDVHTGDQREDRLAGTLTSGRVLPLVALVFAASAIVALATKQAWLLPPAFHLGTGWSWAVRVAGAAVAAAGVTGLLAQRRVLRPSETRAPDPTVVALRTAGIIMAVVTLVALGHMPSRSVSHEGSGGSTVKGPTAGQPPGDGPGRPALSIGGNSLVAGSRTPGGDLPSDPTAHRPPPGAPPNAFHRLARLLLRLLALVAALFVFMALLSRLRNRRRPLEFELPSAHAEAEAGLEASLEAIYREDGDPRDQITLAYRRLLLALATVDAPRRPEEAPHEHLHRVMGALGVPPGPLHRLTELYVEAQFSRRPVTDEHRAAAAEALEASLASLRSVRVPVGAALPATGLVEALA